MSKNNDIEEEPVNDEELEIARDDDIIEGYAEDDLGLDSEDWLESATQTTISSNPQYQAIISDCISN